jgi:alkylresorcinol/alkylpyrone synthase
LQPGPFRCIGYGAPAARTGGSLAAATHPRIAAVGRALPAHWYDQETLLAALQAHWSAHHFNADRLGELHRAVQVKGRHLALPLEAYPALTGFGKANDAWIGAAAELGEAAVRDGLARAGLSPADVDQFWFVTTTGLSVPSLDARLCNRLGLKRQVRRTPVFGLGCAAGAGGTARAADMLRAVPGEVAVMLSVELCSLTLQRDDASIANAVSSGLFGDGAAAVVLGGGDRPGPGPRVLATRTVLYPDTEWVMGWDVVDGGFKVVLSGKVPEVVRTRIGPDVDAFLAAHGLARGDVRHWVAHTGGPKVLTAFGEALGLPEAALARSRRSLAELGNLSSASVLFVLGDLLDSGEAREGDLGVLAAMGPGFGAELLLLRW